MRRICAGYLASLKVWLRTSSYRPNHLGDSEDPGLWLKVPSMSYLVFLRRYRLD
jgi:hypothetical protein